MKTLLIVANFKSYLNNSEARNWLDSFSSLYSATSDKRIILCPSFTLLQLFRDYIKEKKLKIELGAQNISRLPQGPYTGEVNGDQIKDYASFVIIGHSERREFGEDESVVEEKVKIASNYGLTPILCIQSEKKQIPQESSIVAYEPSFAIGTGNPDTPENAENIAENIKKERNLDFILYGGSVNGENVKDFTKQKNINGVLVGGESLNPKSFLAIVKNA